MNKSGGTMLSKTQAVILVTTLAVVGFISLYYQSKSKYAFFRFNAATDTLRIVPFILFLVFFYYITLFSKTDQKEEYSNEIVVGEDSLVKKPWFIVLLVVAVLGLMVYSFVRSISIAKRGMNSNSKVFKLLGMYQLGSVMLPFVIIFIILLIGVFGYIKNKLKEKEERN